MNHQDDRHKARRIAFFTLLLFFPALALPAAGPAGDDATFRKVSKEYTLRKDGSTEFRCRKEVTLNTYFAFHRLYGETFIVYNPAFQRLNINECYTVMADGTRVPAPPNAFNEVLPRFAGESPAYNGLKEMVVTHTGLEIGATIVLDYTLTSDRGLIPGLQVTETIAEANPVQEWRMKVTVPEDATLQYRLANRQGEPVVMPGPAGTTYTWTLHSIPAYLPEPDQPDESLFVPQLRLSTTGLREAVNTLVAADAFRYVFSDEMMNWADNAVKEQKDPLGRALALQEKVVREFRLYGVPAALTAYRVRTAEETWKSNGGTEWEKAVLLVSLLESQAIRAFPVALFPGDAGEITKGLQDIRHMYVAAYTGETDPVVLSVHELNDADLLLTRGQADLLPIVPEHERKVLPMPVTKDRVVVKGTYELTADNKLEGNLSLDRWGVANPFLLLTRDPKKARGGIRGGISTGDLRDSKIRETGPGFSGIASYVSKNDALKKQGDFYFFDWPYAEKGLTGLASELPLIRNNPIAVPDRFSESQQGELTLPDRWRLLNPVQEEIFSNRAGRMQAVCRQEGNRVSWTREIVLKGKESGLGEQEYYQDLRTLLIRWNSLKTSIIKAS